MLIVAGTLTIDPSRRAAAESAFERMRAATLAEAGCLEYQAYFDRQDPSVIFMFERWESPEVLATHFRTPHMAEFGKALAGLGVKGMSIRKYEARDAGSVP